jgi:serine/threonine-protein kinase
LKRSRARLGAAVLGVAVVADGSVAQAQEKAAAQTAFDEGRRLASSGDHGGACAWFEASERLEPAVGTLLNLADCYEKLGRSASEWAALREAAARAALAGEDGRAEFAKAKANALEPMLARIEVSVQSPVDGLQVQRDDVAVFPTLWGSAVPVDPGPHVITVRAPGAMDWSTRIDVPRGPGLAIVMVPPLASRAPSARAPVPVTPDALKERVDGRFVAGLVTMAAGGGGLVAAAVAGAGAIDRKAAGERDEALGWAEAFDWIAVPSALTLIAGTVIFGIDRASAPHNPRVVLAPAWKDRGAGLVAVVLF